MKAKALKILGILLCIFGIALALNRFLKAFPELMNWLTSADEQIMMAGMFLLMAIIAWIIVIVSVVISIPKKPFGIGVIIGGAIALLVYVTTVMMNFISPSDDVYTFINILPFEPILYLAGGILLILAKKKL